MESTVSFGYWVRRRRKALDLTQAQLARQVGCALATIKKIEADERRPSRLMAERLADCLNIPAMEREAFIASARAELAPDRLASPSTVPAAQSNLPTPATALIGREWQVAAVCAMLRMRDAERDARLVTLTGPAGVGKTRLSVVVAQRLRDDFSGDVLFVALASVRDPALVLSAIAQALGLKENAALPLLDLLKTNLRDRRVLLVLDNFEHVLAAAPAIAELLTSAPALKVMVTSRAVLRISGEHEFRVPPLELPAQAAPSTDWERYGAIRLFVERARAVRQDFALTVELVEPVAEICRRLDGLPLAIELAAARIKVLSPHELLLRLERRLELLTSGPRDLPRHQQTLRRALEWSYDLLDEAEQRLFARLGVFVGGCTLQAAEAVCGEDDQADVLDRLALLVDQSMAQRVTSPTGESRFVMLETLGEYALERLNARGEAAMIQRRHQAYYATLAEEAQPELMGGEFQVWADRLEAEHDNIRAALAWALGDESQEIDASRGARLAAACWPFWYLRGYLSEGRRWLERAVDRHAAPDQTRARILSAAGALAWQQGNYTMARPWLEEGVALWRAQDVLDKAGLAEALHLLGHAVFDQRDYAAARAHFEDSLALYRDVENTLQCQTLVSDVGMVAYHLGDYATAQMHFEESLASLRAQGNQDATGDILIRLGDLARLAGDYRRAGALYDESLTLSRAGNIKLGIASGLHKLGYVAQHQRDHVHAASRFAESLALQRELGNKQGIAECLAGLAGLAAAMEEPERAARLFGATLALLDAMGAPLAPADRAEWGRDEAAVRAQLGQQGFASAWSAGRAMSLDQAMAEAKQT